jgi:hypothetical protein
LTAAEAEPTKEDVVRLVTAAFRVAVDEGVLSKANLATVLEYLDRSSDSATPRIPQTR